MSGNEVAQGRRKNELKGNERPIFILGVIGLFTTLALAWHGTREPELPVAAAQPAPNPIPLGQPGMAGHGSMIVMSAQTSLQWHNPDFTSLEFEPSPGGAFVEVTWTYRHSGAKPLDPQQLPKVFLVDELGEHYAPSHSVRASSAVLHNGMSRTFTDIFEVSSISFDPLNWCLADGEWDPRWDPQRTACHALI